MGRCNCRRWGDVVVAQHTGTKEKELFKIDGATHIETYWVPLYVDAAVTKLTDFYGKSLAK
jgi:hypothetical protein